MSCPNGRGQRVAFRFHASRLAGDLARAAAGLLRASLGSGHVLVAEASFFSKMAAVTFGGAYAVLSYVAQQAVEVHDWLRPDEMLTGLGLAETTPGPLILVLVFVGFPRRRAPRRVRPARRRHGGRGGGAVVHLRAVLPLDFRRRALCRDGAQHVRWLASALAAVTAAVVGIIANLAMWFSLHVLFAEVGRKGRRTRLAIPGPRCRDFRCGRSRDRVWPPASR